jgi:hypothetical protein
MYKNKHLAIWKVVVVETIDPVDPEGKARKRWQNGVFE